MNINMAFPRPKRRILHNFRIYIAGRPPSPKPYFRREFLPPALRSARRQIIRSFLNNYGAKVFPRAADRGITTRYPGASEITRRGTIMPPARITIDVRGLCLFDYPAADAATAAHILRGSRYELIPWFR